MKKILFLILCALFFQNADPTFAKTPIARSSAKLVVSNSLPKKDRRAEILEQFLIERGSPLAPHAQTFIDEADKNKIDWKLVVAISGNESQFGLLIPPYSNNGWGYGVYGNNVRNFASWDEGIVVVSKALRKDYLDMWGATNIYEIGAIYAEDPLWANKVSYYLTLIEEYDSEPSNTSISISL
ncbi:MAG TPA: hypothetical protein VM077_03500 [Candidatus Limnocylindrales bacterium]|nr:hypothetical protein [Candidatus Limnocylindrales bacterium]